MVSDAWSLATSPNSVVMGLSAARVTQEKVLPSCPYPMVFDNGPTASLAFPFGFSAFHTSLPLSGLSFAALTTTLFGLLFLLTLCKLGSHACYLGRVFTLGGAGVAMDGLGPRNAADFLRSEQRVRSGPLPAGRVVLPRTTQLRTGYLDVFREWCGSQGIDLEFLLENFRECIDELNLVLCRFGRRLYEVGRPRSHYIETINGLTSI